MTMLALRYEGDGNFSTPHRKLADQRYVVGETLTWEVVDTRSMKSHRYYFAKVADLWQTLPEHLVDEFPNPDALRKYALVKSGFCYTDKIVCASNGEALKLVTSLQRREEYCVVSMDGKIVTISTAMSQKLKRGDNGGMDAKTFRDSTESVLAVIAELLGTSTDAVRDAA